MPVVPVVECLGSLAALHQLIEDIDGSFLTQLSLPPCFWTRCSSSLASRNAHNLVAHVGETIECMADASCGYHLTRLTSHMIDEDVVVGIRVPTEPSKFVLNLVFILFIKLWQIVRHESPD